MESPLAHTASRRSSPSSKKSGRASHCCAHQTSKRQVVLAEPWVPLPAGPDLMDWFNSTRFVAALNISGLTVTRHEISRVLNTEPDDARRVGDSNRGGDWTARWTIRTDGRVPATADLGTHIESLLDRLPSDPALWRGLAESSISIMTVTWFQDRGLSSFGFAPSLLCELARRSISLLFFAESIADVPGDVLSIFRHPL